MSITLIKFWTNTYHNPTQKIMQTHVSYTFCSLMIKLKYILPEQAVIFQWLVFLTVYSKTKMFYLFLEFSISKKIGSALQFLHYCKPWNNKYGWWRSQTVSINRNDSPFWDFWGQSWEVDSILKPRTLRRCDFEYA